MVLVSEGEDLEKVDGPEGVIVTTPTFQVSHIESSKTRIRGSAPGHSFSSIDLEQHLARNTKGMAEPGKGNIGRGRDQCFLLRGHCTIDRRGSLLAYSCGSTML